MNGWLPQTLRASAPMRRLCPGQMLFSQGDRSAGCYEIVGGKMKLTRVDSMGREVVLGFASAGETIAEVSLFSQVHDYDAIAMEHTAVRLHHKAALLPELGRNPEAAKAVIALLVTRVIDLRTRLERQSLPARDRVRHYLTNNARGQDRTAVLPGTVKDLAAELGLTHEALYRTLSGMEARGEITRHQGKIRIAAAAYDWDHRYPQLASVGVGQGADKDPWCARAPIQAQTPQEGRQQGEFDGHFLGGSACRRQWPRKAR